MRKMGGERQRLPFTEFDERREYDVRIGYAGKRYRPLSQIPLHKAKVVTIYRNGDPFSPGTKVTFQVGRDFSGLSNLLDYLSQKINVPQGVRYIFNLNGKTIRDIEELEDGQRYVASGVRVFQALDYGHNPIPKTAQMPAKVNIGPLRPGDIKYLRPISSDNSRKSMEGKRSQESDAGHRGSGTWSLPESTGSRVITAVNGYDHSIRRRVLLNLRTRQTFEEVLEDMGQSIKIENATRMLTPWGEKVMSFSHLKSDFFEVETFFLDRGDLESTLEQGGRRFLTTKQKKAFKREARSNSAPDSKVEPDRRDSKLVIPVEDSKLTTLRVRIPQNY